VKEERIHCEKCGGSKFFLYKTNNNKVRLVCCDCWLREEEASQRVKAAA